MPYDCSELSNLNNYEEFLTIYPSKRFTYAKKYFFLDPCIHVYLAAMY
jgi:hypothetical protein